LPAAGAEYALLTNQPTSGYHTSVVGQNNASGIVLLPACTCSGLFPECLYEVTLQFIQLTHVCIESSNDDQQEGKN